MKSKFTLGSWTIVALIIGALTVWMLSGVLGGGHHGEVEASAAPAGATGKPQFTVQVRSQTAEKIQRLVQVNGETRPDKVINIASQVEGQVIEVGPRKGARVAEGALLARVDTRDFESQKTKATAVVHTRTLEYGAALKLRETGYVTEGELAAKLAALETARADLKDIELRLANLAISAPVSGILEDRMVEKGDYVKTGQGVAKLIKIDPLVVTADVNEKDIPFIRVGDRAEAEILGQTLRGEVRFVSALADERTRTFTVELTVDNPNSQIPAGLSARVSVPVQEVLAHRLPASLLSLADNGDIGVKHVVDGRVVFTLAQIVRADGDAVFVAGLPQTAQLITRGQGFVKAGETVAVELEKTAAAGSQP